MLHDLTIRTIAFYLVAKNSTLHRLMRLNTRFYSLRLCFIQSLHFGSRTSIPLLAQKPEGWNRTYSLDLEDVGDGSVLKDCRIHKLILHLCTHFDPSHLFLLRHVHILTLQVLLQVTDLSALADSRIKNISLKYLSNLSDLSSLTNMTKITLYSCHQITDLSPLSQSRLKYLYISGCNGITDLAPIANIRTVIISYCDNITDVSVFAKSSIRRLNIYKCPRLTDVSILKLNKNLTFVDNELVLEWS